MANPIELAIKVKADTKKLWDDLTKVDRKADETKRKIQDVGRESARVARQAEQQARTQIRPGLARLGQGLGAAGGVIGAGGDLTMAGAAFLGSTFPELAAFVAAIRGYGSVSDWVQGVGPKIKAGEFQALNPTSVADEIAALEKTSRAKARKFSFTKFATGFLDSTAARERDEFAKEFRKLVRRNPALAADVLATAGGERPYLRKIYEEETRKMGEEAARLKASESFMTRYQQTTTVNAAVNVSSTAGAGRGSVGRTLTEYQDSRDRNNGRYVSTSSRRR